MESSAKKGDVLGDGWKIGPPFSAPSGSALRWDICCVPMYHSTYVSPDQVSSMIEIERVQTGIRIERRLLKVLKALAELKDLSLGDLLEGMVLHAFEGKAPFGKETLGQIGELKRIYGLTLTAGDSHQLKEAGDVGR